MKKNHRLVAFGASIRRLRQLKGWSQERFAEEAGLDRTYVGGVERGERNVSLLNLQRLAEALGMNLSHLFDESAPTRERGKR
jgi:transcriptional regulator with XRE-family HTH domain